MCSLVKNPSRDRLKELSYSSQNPLIRNSMICWNAFVSSCKSALHNTSLRKTVMKLLVTGSKLKAAPTFFPTYRSTAGTPLVDGGMWANNPVGFAVVEALGVLGWDKDQLRILSVGCTRSPLDVGLGRHFGLGKFYWGQKVVDVFMSGQSSASLGTAQLLAGHKNV